LERLSAPQLLKVDIDPVSYDTDDTPSSVIDAEGEIYTIGLWGKIDTSVFLVADAVNSNFPLYSPYVAGELFAGIAMYNPGDDVEDDYAYTTDLISGSSGSSLDTSTQFGYQLKVSLESGTQFAFPIGDMAITTTLGARLSYSKMHFVNSSAGNSSSSFGAIADISDIDYKVFFRLGLYF